MESWENKVIAEKVDSLGNLPEGYTPNLTSKWEIIQSGLAKHPKSSIYKTSLPVILLLLSGVVAIWILKTQPEEKVDAVATHTTLPVTITPKVSDGPVNKAVANKKLSTAKKKVSNPELTAGHRLEKKRDVVILPPIIQGQLVMPDTLQVKANDTFRTATPIAIKTKQARKVYQRDFNGIISVADPTQQKTAQKSLEIKLGLQSNKGVSTGQPPSLRLTQNF